MLSRLTVTQEVVEVVQHWIARKSDQTTQHRMSRTNWNDHRKNLDGKTRNIAYKDRVAETERVKERTRARVERGRGDVLVELGNEEHMADRHAVVSGVEEKQYEENRMRDVHIGEKGSETANEEQ